MGSTSSTLAALMRVWILSAYIMRKQVWLVNIVPPNCLFVHIMNVFPPLPFAPHSTFRHLPLVVERMSSNNGVHGARGRVLKVPQSQMSQST